MSMNSDPTRRARVLALALAAVVLVVVLAWTATSASAADRHWYDDGPIVGPSAGDNDGLAGVKNGVRPHVDVEDGVRGDGPANVLVVEVGVTQGGRLVPMRWTVATRWAWVFRFITQGRVP